MLFCPQLHQMLTDILALRLNTECIITKSSSNIPPHLNSVATLPCEILARFDQQWLVSWFFVRHLVVTILFIGNNFITPQFLSH